MDIEKQAADFRKQVAARAEVGPRLRYTPQMREQALAYARFRHAAGVSIAQIAGELRLRTATLSAWMQAGPAAPAFCKVEVVSDPQTVEHRPLVVHGPSGLRIEGLDIAGLSELLRSLA